MSENPITTNEEINDYQLINNYSQVIIDITGYLNTIEHDYNNIIDNDYECDCYKPKLIELLKNLESYQINIKLVDIQFRLGYAKFNNILFSNFINSEIKSLHNSHVRIEKMIKDKINNNKHNYNKYKLVFIAGIAGYILGRLT